MVINSNEERSLKKEKKPRAPREFESLYKLLVVGDSETGKTQLVSQFCHNEFSKSYIPTLIMDHSTKLLENRKIFAQIWDMSGQEMFRTVTSSYYQNAVGAIVVYDVARVRSFQNAEKWIDCLREKTSGNCPLILLVGNKCDLRERRCISSEDGHQLAKRKDVLFMETSALEGTNANRIFLRLIDHVTNRIDQKELKSICSNQNKISQSSSSENEAKADKNQNSIYVISSQPKSKFTTDRAIIKCAALGQDFLTTCLCFGMNKN